jgi:hypothetical protein
VRRLAIAAAGLAVLAGCGGGGGANADRFSGAKQDVARAIDDLQSAARAGDGRRICSEMFTPRLVKALAKASGGKACTVRVRQQLARKGETITVQSIAVNGDSAVAVVKEQNRRVSRLALAKAGGRWRIDGIAAAA